MNGQTAPITMDLFFPITGYLDDGEEPVYEVSDNFVFRYRCEITTSSRNTRSAVTEISPRITVATQV